MLYCNWEIGTCLSDWIYNYRGLVDVFSDVNVSPLVVSSVSGSLSVHVPLGVETALQLVSLHFPVLVL